METPSGFDRREGGEGRLKIPTTRFGTLEIGADQIIQVPTGIIGFPECKRYVLLEHRQGSSFFWLQSLDNEALAFVVINPLLFQPDYTFDLSPEDRQALEIQNGQAELQTLAIVNIAHREKDERTIEITANLLGPIVVNIPKRLARQLILDKYQLFPRLVQDMRAFEATQPGSQVQTIHIPATRPKPLTLWQRLPIYGQRLKMKLP